MSEIPNDASRTEHIDGEERLTGHVFDGIEEFDNPTPAWWHMIFVGSIVFSFFYLAFFTGELGWTPEGEHRSAQMRYFEQLFGELGELEPTDDTFLMLMAEPDWMTVGNGIFASNCAQCHGSNGGGINGANLTDDLYANVKNLNDVYSVITDGVVAKGMPAWGVRLNQNQRIVVAAYVASLRGTNAPGGRAPEENAGPIDPWPQPVASADGDGEEAGG